MTTPQIQKSERSVYLIDDGTLKSSGTHYHSNAIFRKRIECPNF